MKDFLYLICKNKNAFVLYFNILVLLHIYHELKDFFIKKLTTAPPSIKNCQQNKKDIPCHRDCRLVNYKVVYIVHINSDTTLLHTLYFITY